MIEQLRRYIGTTAGRVVAIALALVVVAFAVYQIKAYLHGDTPDDANYSMYVDSESGKSFRHRNEMGEHTPILSPFSGKQTGYPAEPCSWTKDGQVRSEPYWVMLNSCVGKPEPTFCPDCGRLVVGHNPEAVAGHRPPMTQDEWAAAH